MKNKVVSVDDKLNDTTNKVTFDHRNTKNALRKKHMTNKVHHIVIFSENSIGNTQLKK